MTAISHNFFQVLIKLPLATQSNTKFHLLDLILLLEHVFWKSKVTLRFAAASFWQLMMIDLIKNLYFRFPRFLLEYLGIKLDPPDRRKGRIWGITCRNLRLDLAGGLYSIIYHKSAFFGIFFFNQLAQFRKFIGCPTIQNRYTNGERL